MHNTPYSDDTIHESEKRKITERKKVYDQFSKILLFEQNIRKQYKTIRHI